VKCCIMVEVEAVLSECREEDDSCATLARLKMAIEYEEKKVSVDVVKSYILLVSFSLTMILFSNNSHDS